MQLSTMTPSSRATWSDQNNQALREYMNEDRVFQDFVRYNLCTPSRLLHLDLSTLYPKIGCGDIKGKTSGQGLDVQPFLDRKIRDKLYREFPKWGKILATIEDESEEDTQARTGGGGGGAPEVQQPPPTLSTLSTSIVMNFGENRRRSTLVRYGTESRL